MTPEQILIDGIDKAPHRGSCQQLWSFKEGRDGSYEIQPCDCWKTETLQAYNEAKATEEDPQWLIGVELDRILENAENGLLRATDVNRIRHLRDELLGYQPAASAKNTQVQDLKEALSPHKKLLRIAQAFLFLEKTINEFPDNPKWWDVDVRVSPLYQFTPTERDWIMSGFWEDSPKMEPQDLLTAHPLAEALRGFCDHTECDDNGYTIRGTCCSCEALTQHEALIKQSKAVWAMVKLALEHFEVVEDTCPEIIPDETRLILKALPVEALEMMEMKQL